MFVDKNGRKELAKETNGNGGFQSLERILKRNYNPLTHELILNKKQQERVYRYGSKYGNGGWEDRLKAICPSLFLK